MNEKVRTMGDLLQAYQKYSQNAKNRVLISDFTAAIHEGLWPFDPGVVTLYWLERARALHDNTYVVMVELQNMSWMRQEWYLSVDDVQNYEQRVVRSTDLYQRILEFYRSESAIPTGDHIELGEN